MVIGWSVAGGFIVGLLADALLIGAGAILLSFMPVIAKSRWVSSVAVLLLATIPLVAATLGYLEGRLKAQ